MEKYLQVMIKKKITRISREKFKVFTMQIILVHLFCDLEVTRASYSKFKIIYNQYFLKLFL